MFLMNKNKTVLEFDYDEVLHSCKKIINVVNPEYAPPIMLSKDLSITEAGFDRWWEMRAIPDTRQGYAKLLNDLDINDSRILLEINHGLSLTDCYWINDGELTWENINFFDNDFSGELGILTSGGTPKNKVMKLLNPSSSLNGALKKKWVIGKDGVRYLYKKSFSAFGIECYAERIASKLYERMLAEGEYVPYKTVVEDGELFCVCPNMLDKDEELISMLDITYDKISGLENDFEHLLECISFTGIPDIELKLSQMFVCDFIIGNCDRHYQNFGLIRDVETLEYKRLAPVYDSGNSLWAEKLVLQPEKSEEYIAKPFGTYGEDAIKQLKRIKKWEWFDSEKLTGFSDEVREILSENSNISAERIELTAKSVEHQIELVEQVYKENI